MTTERLSRDPHRASVASDRAAPVTSRSSNHREFCATTALRLARPDERLERRGERPTNSELRGDRFDDRRAPCLDGGRSVRRWERNPRRSPQSPHGSRRNSRPAPPSSCRLPPIVAPSAAIAAGSASLAAPTAPIARARASRATPTSPNRGSLRRDPRVFRGNRRARRGNRHEVRVDRLKLRGKTRELWGARLFERGSRHSGRVARLEGGRDRGCRCRQTSSPAGTRTLNEVAFEVVFAVGSGSLCPAPTASAMT
jgi:hypothetical protein